MKTSTLAIAFAAALAAASTTAHAQRTISFDPPNPTPLDEVTLVLSDTTATCPSLLRTSLRFVGGVIHAVQGSLDCTTGAYSQTRLPLGRFPAGTYAVQIHRNTIQDPVDIAASLTVEYAAGTGTTAATAPPYNFTGHYLTQSEGEGVFIQQYNGRSFLSLFTYEADGRGTWLVMPSGTFQYNANTGFGFVSPVYTAQRPPGAGTIVLTEVGTSSWVSFTPGQATLTTTINGTTTSRFLRRFRF